MRAVKLRERRVKVPSRSLILPGTGAEIAREMRLGHPASLAACGGGQRGIPAPYPRRVGFAALLAGGTVAAALHGRLDATGVLIACTVVSGATSFAAEP